MSLHVHIRPARSNADLEAAAQLFQAYAASLEIDLAYQDFASELATLPGSYAPPRGELLLAWDAQHHPVGCVALRPLDAEGCCEMKRLYVTRRGLGIGHALVDALIAEARRIGYKEMRLDSLPAMKEAIALYKKTGFLPTEPYYDTPIAGTVFLALRITPASA